MAAALGGEESLTLAEDRLADLRAYIEAIEQGTVVFSEEELAAAGRALASIKAREGEDIEEWARRLTEDADKWQ